MINFPNTETVRHLCHFHGGVKYYLLSSEEYENPIIVCDIDNIELLAKELKSWCGMEIDVFNIENKNSKTLKTINNGIALHLASESMTLVEE